MFSAKGVTTEIIKQKNVVKTRLQPCNWPKKRRRVNQHFGQYFSQSLAGHHQQPSTARWPQNPAMSSNQNSMNTNSYTYVTKILKNKQTSFIPVLIFFHILFSAGQWPKISQLPSWLFPQRMHQESPQLNPIKLMWHELEHFLKCIVKPEIRKSWWREFPGSGKKKQTLQSDAIILDI